MIDYEGMNTGYEKIPILKVKQKSPIKMSQINKPGIFISARVWMCVTAHAICVTAHAICVLTAHAFCVILTADHAFLCDSSGHAFCVTATNISYH